MKDTVNTDDSATSDEYLPEFDAALLPVGSTCRGPLHDYKLPREIRTATDLPSRLYLGSIVPESFQLKASGWRVRYEDTEPDTFVELELKEVEGPLVARFVWRGIEGMSTWTSGADWKGLVRQMSTVFPETWEEEAGKRLSAYYNVRSVSHDQEVPLMTGFPDGAFRTVIFPLPSHWLPDLVNLLDALDADSEIAAIVNISIVLTEARIDYVQGRCPDVPDDPAALARHSRNAIGLPCHGLPRRQTAEEGGLHLLEVDRWVYLAHVACAFRDLERVIAHCNQCGFSGSAGLAETPSDYPHGAEWAALVSPGRDGDAEP